MTHSLELAREIESAIKGDLARGKFDIYEASKELTLDAVFEKYMPFAKSKKKTWANDESIYKRHIQPVFGHKKLSQILPIHIEKFKSDLKKAVNRNGKPYAPQTIKHILIIIRRLYNMAVKWDLYKGKKPMDKVEMPKVDNEIISLLTTKQTARLVETLDAWPDVDGADFIRLALLTGLRRSELLKLHFAQIDFEKDKIRLLNPKGGKSISIPVSDGAMDVFKRRYEYSCGFVFPGKSEGHRYDIKRPWAHISKAAGLEGLRLHDLRHNFASQLVSADVSINIIKELLTHKDIQTTMKYAHVKDDILKAAAKKSFKMITEPEPEAEVVELDKVRVKK
ncbi:MAG: site-specific integrase [Desulfobacteraceae bacterium]|nr:site-specific integrase [Desulfobacteraceae bacterium]